MDRSIPLTLKLERGSNPFSIPESSLQRTFQVARDSMVRSLIEKIPAGSQAEKMNLMSGDIIVCYDGKPVTTVDSFFEAVESARTEQVKMVILRGEKEIILNVKKGYFGAWIDHEYY